MKYNVEQWRKHELILSKSMIFFFFLHYVRASLLLIGCILNRKPKVVLCMSVHVCNCVAIVVEKMPYWCVIISKMFNTCIIIWFMVDFFLYFSIQNASPSFSMVIFFCLQYNHNVNWKYMYCYVIVICYSMLL